MKFTKHAEARMQQRAISKVDMEILQLFGEEQYQKGGTHIVTLTRKSQKKVQKELKSLLSRLDRDAAYYYVCSNDESVITAGHLFKKNR